jgi:MFS family permease|tara:strand:+ start:1724 stop:2986 length:1263 start_codon:yes stop_codon:yes gene_type:complete
LFLSSGLKDKLYYGWVMVFAFWVIGITLYGIHFSFGVFFKSIESEFGLTRAVTSVILSANMIIAGVCSFFAGWALERYGPRIVLLLMGLFTGLSLLLTSQADAFWQLFLTHGMLLAMGTGPLFVVSMAAVSRWFDKKRTLALGVSSSGLGLGPLVMAPFATYLISNFDWRTAYIVIGIIAWLVVMPLSRLLKRDPYETGVLPDGVKTSLENIGDDHIPSVGFSFLQALQTKSFWLFIVTWFLYASNIFLVMTHLVPHATDIGFSAVQAATILSLIGAAVVAGRILMSVTADRIGKKVTVVICVLLQAGAMIWLMWAQDLWMLYLFALVYGFAFGGVSPAMAALVGDTFGLGRLGSILGILEVGFGVGAAVGPVVGGLIFDINHSYFVAFLLGAVAMFAVALFVTLIRREMKGNSVNAVSR